ncbi:MAG: hypothetical protein OEZ57_08310 [Nitrospirota bacterium]|nr:hypothetical protein [Nitrospirota bacterium]MDH5587830.1 hypothetical protein [Nitrospirota bacterium]MDH5774905.1 hypothetical protein [Nitrospirota bacterium]
MGIGHYGVSFALKAVDKNISLGLLFVAAQFVDILWLIFVLLGIERVHIVPGVTAANPFDFVFYPFTHSLVASFFWAGAVYMIFRLIPVKPASRQSQVALVLGAAVLSHFFLDLIVHRPDLPLASGDSYKIGLGLWNSVLASSLLEGLLLLGGLWVYLDKTKSLTVMGKYGMSIFAVCLLVANLSVYREDVLNFFLPLPLTPENFASFTLGYHFLFVGIAFWLDQKRG